MTERPQLPKSPFFLSAALLYWFENFEKLFGIGSKARAGKARRGPGFPKGGLAAFVLQIELPTQKGVLNMHKAFKKSLVFALSALMVAGLAACGGTTSSGTTAPASGSASGAAAPAGEGQVYFLNFKPEQDAAYQTIAATYTEETGVPVKVVTAASGTYEQTLRSEIVKQDAPTIFQINGPVGYNSWKDYCADLSGTELYADLNDPNLAISSGDGVYGIPFAIEGYGIIVNTKIMDAYFALDGAVAASLDDINSFDTLKAVVEDMQAKAADLGITGVFASTSLMPGEDWRWQTHLMNVPMYYEWTNNDVDITDPAQLQSITFEYNPNYQQIFDLYLNNSTIAPAMTGSKTVDDSMSEFALGECAMVQNGNWAYGQISGVEGNVVEAGDVQFIPIYTGMDGEETQGLCIGTENFFCINSQASEADQQASIDFFTWLYTSDEGKGYVTNDLGFIAPFNTFTSDEVPADPLGQQVVEWSSNDAVTNLPWDFTVFPSQQFKDDFGADLLLYAQGQEDWATVTQNVIDNWAAEEAATATDDGSASSEAAGSEAASEAASEVASEASSVASDMSAEVSSAA